jgi:hypothetical protein
MMHETGWMSIKNVIQPNTMRIKNENDLHMQKKNYYTIELLLKRFYHWPFATTP